MTQPTECCLLKVDLNEGAPGKKCQHSPWCLGIVQAAGRTPNSHPAVSGVLCTVRVCKARHGMRMGVCHQEGEGLDGSQRVLPLSGNLCQESCGSPSLGVSRGCRATLASLPGVHRPTSPDKGLQSWRRLQRVIKTTQNHVSPLSLEKIVWEMFFQ